MTRAHEVLDYVGHRGGALPRARRVLDRHEAAPEAGAGARARPARCCCSTSRPTGSIPKGRRHMLELVHDLGHAQGKSLLLCSHLLPDVERTCDATWSCSHKGRSPLAGVDRGADAQRRAAGVRASRSRATARRFRARARGAGGYERRGRRRRVRLRVRLDERRRATGCSRSRAERRRVAAPSSTTMRSTLEEVFVEALRAADGRSARERRNPSPRSTGRFQGKLRAHRAALPGRSCARAARRRTKRKLPLVILLRAARDRDGDLLLRRVRQFTLEAGHDAGARGGGTSGAARAGDRGGREAEQLIAGAPSRSSHFHQAMSLFALLADGLVRQRAVRRGPQGRRAPALLRAAADAPRLLRSASS